MEDFCLPTASPKTNSRVIKSEPYETPTSMMIKKSRNNLNIKMTGISPIHWADSELQSFELWQEGCVEIKMVGFQDLRWPIKSFAAASNAWRYHQNMMFVNTLVCLTSYRLFRSNIRTFLGDKIA